MNTQTQIANELQQFTHFCATIWPLAAIVFAVYLILAIIVVTITIFSKKESTEQP